MVEDIALPRVARAKRRYVIFSLACVGACTILGCGNRIPEGTDAYDVERYDLKGHYDWDQDRLVATTLVTFALTDPSAQAITLDSRVTEVLSVRGADGQSRPFEADADSGILTVDISSIAGSGPISLEIDYTAAPGDSLRAVPPRAGDPVSVRAVFTDSEPERASLWMPCHNRPDDRAVFSAEMTMPAGETLISNGALVKDETTGGERTMKYETADPIPTYLMAFAISEFEVEEATEAKVPISVWRRKGVPGDFSGLAQQLQTLFGTFESLMGPYRFEKYALVILPEFSGGMENASITFQSETTTSDPGTSIGLNAHELGHQWFGDAVTVATWDDVWVKEGMATLLETEALRPFEDTTQSGVLFGDRFYVVADQAIRDTSLDPADKYTTGPYDRAAWLYTQIRAVVGDAVFWSTLRDLIDDHLYGTLSTDDVLSAFAPALGKDAAAAAARAVDAKVLPTIDVSPLPSGASVTLQDPTGILVAPLEIEWHREDGTLSRQALVPGQPVSLERESEGDLLVIDPMDVHPDLSLWLSPNTDYATYEENLIALTLPAAPSSVSTFTTLPGIHQYAALASGLTLPLSPDEFEPFIASLDAESARATSSYTACSIAQSMEDPALQQAWIDALSVHVTNDPPWHGLPFALRPGSCSGLLSPEDLFAASYADLAAGKPSDTLTADRAYYLATFNLPFQDGIEHWGQAAKTSYSMRIRSIAARYIRLRSAAAISDDAQDAVWRSTILDLLATSDASEVLRQLTGAVYRFRSAPEADRDAFLSQMLRILNLPMARLTHASAICGAVILSVELIGDQLTLADKWGAFALSLADAPLSAQARRLLSNPYACL